jgi:cell division protein FtsQ
MADESKQPPTTVKKGRKRKRNRKNNKTIRLFIVGVSFFVLILLIVFFSSSLSRVQQIEVKGNDLIDATAIIESSDVKQGDQFLLVWQDDVSEAVKRLGSIEKVTLEKEFPGFVRIIVKEFPKVAYIDLPNDEWQAVLANGKRLPATMNITADKPMLSGWNEGAAKTLLPKLTEALLKVKSEHLQDLSQIVPIPTKTFPDKIKMYTRSGFEIVSTIELFPKKIEFLQGVIRDVRAKKQEGGTIYLMETIYHRPIETTQNEN